jgi:nucleoside-diphosphate-sugar epimerase
MTSRVLVTGSNGLVGRATVERLLADGYDVRGADLQESSDTTAIEYRVCDVRRYDDVCDALRSCDAVVHLAALPSPRFADSSTTFEINSMGTFNVFEAAAQLGIQRVAQASSVNAMGFTWNLGDFVPDRLPIDETQSVDVTDPYSFSKHVSEQIGEYAWRRNRISSVALRMPGVLPPGQATSDEFVTQQSEARAFIDWLDELPPADRDSLLVEVRNRVLAFRAKRALEFGREQPEPAATELGDVPEVLWQQYMWGRFMLWSIVDVRDAAQAFSLALTAEYDGAHPLFISDDANSVGCDPLQLARLFYPGVEIVPEELQPGDSLISIERARRLLNYQPEHSARDALRARQ